MMAHQLFGYKIFILKNCWFETPAHHQEKIGLTAIICYTWRELFLFASVTYETWACLDERVIPFQPSISRLCMQIDEQNLAKVFVERYICAQYLLEYRKT